MWNLSECEFVAMRSRVRVRSDEVENASSYGRGQKSRDRLLGDVIGARYRAMCLDVDLHVTYENFI